ncbi:hypothetical protein Taro_018629 [Colocasia esculenta]|uniref:RNase H type-1 domain-containing protein n=1 Tax=Colocasia esculenta TaxID=4460 RepID=A0A843URV8_COLES|nr:hypothetical protein [Colocasia esculenta]
MQGLVQAMQTQAHTQAALQAQLEAQAYEVSSGQKYHFTSVQEVAANMNHPLRNHAAIEILMNNINISSSPDKCVWMSSADGSFSTKSAFRALRPHGVHRPSLLKIWNHTFNPRAALFGWRLLYRAVPTYDRISDCGIYLVSSCSCCSSPSIEDLDHLFLKGDLAVSLWDWARPLLHGQVFGSHITSTLWNIISTVNCNSAMGFISVYVVLLVVWEIWKYRCAKRFDSVHKPVGKIMADIRYAVSVAIQGVKFKHDCSAEYMAVLLSFGFKPTVKLKTPQIVRWIPPKQGVCLNVDGACKGNPGPCGGGGCLRNPAGEVLLSFSFFYGQGDSLLAEVRALIDGLRLAELHGLHVTVVYSNSLVLVQSFTHDKCPSWRCSWWWNLARSLLLQMHVGVDHIFREANRVADALATHACHTQHKSIFSSSSFPTSCKGPVVLDKSGLPSVRLL